MAEGRRREQWVHTSHLLAELMNGARVRKDKKAWLAVQLNPFATKEKKQEKAVKLTPTEFVKGLLRAWM